MQPFSVVRPNFYVSSLAHLALWVWAPAAHITGALCWFTGSTLQAATLLLAGQVSFAVAFLWTVDRKLLLHDIRLFFVAIYALYGLTRPMGTLLFGAYPVPGLTEAVLLYALGMLGFNLILVSMPFRYKAIYSQPLQSRRMDLVTMAAVVGGLCWSLALAVASGHRIALGQLAGARAANGEVSQLWVVTSLVMASLCCFGVYVFPRLGKLAKVVVLCAIVGWILFHLGMGNRRDFTPVLMFALGYYSCRRNLGLRPLHIAALGLLLLGFLYAGIVRLDAATGLNRIQILQMAATQNEFAVPIETAAFYANNPDCRFRMGETYIVRPLQYFVPRNIWEDKPMSLSMEFLLDSVGTTRWQGYAYTPVTEAFINFGWAGPLCAMILLCILLTLLAVKWRKKVWLYLLLFSAIPDFNRGEFATMVYQLTFTIGSFAFAMWAAGVRFEKVHPSPHEVPHG